MGDLGRYGIAELPPAGPLFARGPYRALGQKGNPWEVVRNSISTHVTHAEITHFFQLWWIPNLGTIYISWPMLKQSTISLSAHNALKMGKFTQK